MYFKQTNKKKPEIVTSNVMAFSYKTNIKAVGCTTGENVYNMYNKLLLPMVRMTIFCMLMDDNDDVLEL